MSAASWGPSWVLSEVFQLSDCHAVVADVAREHVFPMLHCAVVEDEVQREEVELGMCREARVTVAH